MSPPPCARCVGKTKKHSTKLTTSTAHTTAGIATITAPITPWIINNGINAAMVVSVDENTGPPMRVAARMAES